jgi:hypothetical protein
MLLILYNLLLVIILHRTSLMIPTSIRPSPIILLAASFFFLLFTITPISLILIPFIQVILPCLFNSLHILNLTELHSVIILILIVQSFNLIQKLLSNSIIQLLRLLLLQYNLRLLLLLIIF